MLVDGSFLSLSLPVSCDSVWNGTGAVSSLVLLPLGPGMVLGHPGADVGVSVEHGMLLRQFQGREGRALTKVSEPVGEEFQES